MIILNFIKIEVSFNFFLQNYHVIYTFRDLPSMGSN
jgi:hypothetical protein